MERDQRGRVFVVTGANAGIGRVTAAELARRGAHVVLACRSEARARPVVDAIRREAGSSSVELLLLDLADQRSVRAAAAELLARGLPLHGLVDNAGLAGRRGQTREGFELAFGTNHLGHFLLTTLLLPRLRESAPARVVTVASNAHFAARGIDWEAIRRPTASLTGLDEYAVSKLANVLFTRELARREAGSGVTAYAVHPGMVASDVWRNVPWGVRHVFKLFLRSPERGAATTLHCATSPEVASHSGRYYEECHERRPSKLAEDDALALELWRRSEAWTSEAAGAAPP